jgi:hypothetical protein
MDLVVIRGRDYLCTEEGLGQRGGGGGGVNHHKNRPGRSDQADRPGPFLRRFGPIFL